MLLLLVRVVEQLLLVADGPMLLLWVVVGLPLLQVRLLLASGRQQQVLLLLRVAGRVVGWKVLPLAVLLLTRRGRCRHGLASTHVRRLTHAAAPASASTSTAAAHPRCCTATRRTYYCLPHHSASATLPHALLTPTPKPVPVATAVRPVDA